MLFLLITHCHCIDTIISTITCFLLVISNKHMQVLYINTIQNNLLNIHQVSNKGNAFCTCAISVRVNSGLLLCDTIKYHVYVHCTGFPMLFFIEEVTTPPPFKKFPLYRQPIPVIVLLVHSILLNSFKFCIISTP